MCQVTEPGDQQQPESGHSPGSGKSADSTLRRERSEHGPVRGFIGLTAAATSPQTTAGSDFSIFVLVQNPFDVPISVHQVQTHIPVELIDVNQLRLKQARLNLPAEGENANPAGFLKRYRMRRDLRAAHTGIATAVGTELSPGEAGELLKSELSIVGDVKIAAGGIAQISGIGFHLAADATPDQLDALMRRVAEYERGVIPVRLQPGDSIVRQFLLRTRSRILFRPLSHTFQIQVNYTVDDLDHTGVIPFQLSIQAALGSIAAGSVTGAALGTAVKSLSTTASLLWPQVFQSLAVALMASVAIVVAFARKSSAQPLVSVEDFWGGLVIGFAVGYFGFTQFLQVFPTG